MLSKKLLKEEMQVTADLTNVVEVMKQVAATHLHHLEKLQVRFDQFAKALQEYFYWLNLKGVQHPFFENKVPARLYVLITSDTGFLGGLNTQIVNEALVDFDRARGDKVIAIGVRGKNLLLDLGYPLEGDFPGISPAIAREEISAVKKLVVDRILEGKFGSATVTYPHYHSITKQSVQRLDLFPCKALPDTEKVPGTGAWHQVPGTYAQMPKLSLEDQFILESPVADIIGYLVELWTSERLYSLFWNSKLSELAARTIHLEGSYQELAQEKKRLAYFYSRCVHEETDRNIREIVAGRGVSRKPKGTRSLSEDQKGPGPFWLPVPGTYDEEGEHHA